MKYEENMKKFHAAVGKKVRAASVLERAIRMRTIEYYPIEVEKWSFPKEIGGKWVHEPPPDENGHYEKEGHNCSDVHGYWDFRWYEPKNWGAQIKRVGEYFKDIYEFVLEPLRNTYGWKYLFEHIKTWVFKYNPFRITLTGWVWVADSVDSIVGSAAWDEAENTVAKKYGYADSAEMILNPRENPPLWRDAAVRGEIQALSDFLKENDRQGLLERHVKEYGYIQVADYMWVQESDPTCFIFNEAVLPFDLKDGWSSRRLGTVVMAWVKLLVGDLVPILPELKYDE